MNKLRQGGFLIAKIKKISGRIFDKKLKMHQITDLNTAEGLFRGIMLKGEMEALQDQENKRMIWRKRDTIYYPKGVTDPDYCVLRFVSESGKLYQKFGSADFIIE